MKKIYFLDEPVTENDLYFLCYMIERISRRLHRHNSYIVNTISKDQWLHLIQSAAVLHCENPLQVEDDWIANYDLTQGDFDIMEINTDLAPENLPTATQMGKVYQRLVVDTITNDETYIDALLRIYNAPICDILDDYTTGAYYEPSYFIARAYANGGF